MHYRMAGRELMGGGGGGRGGKRLRVRIINLTSSHRR
jgi:hypothetical protein